jgi:hypothetical protein
MAVGWFTNKAQMVQMACAIVSALIALMIWLAIPPQNLLYLAPIAFVASLIWTFWLGTRWVRPSPPSVTGHSSGQQPESNDVPKPLSKVEEAIKKQAGEDSIGLVNFTCELGGYWEGKVLGRTFRIILREIGKTEDGKYDKALVEVSDGMRPAHGGRATSRIAPTRFWLPTMASYEMEPSCMFTFDLHELQTRIVILRVDHINPHAKNATFQLCHVSGKPKAA